MKVFIFAQDKQLAGVVSNRQKLWAKILDRLGIEEDDLNTKKRYLATEIYPNWTKLDEVNTEGAKKYKAYSQASLSKLLRTHKQIKIIDGIDEDNSVTIWEREVE